MSLNKQIESWLAFRKKTFQKQNRPFITLAFAQAWDGSITTDKGATVALSSEQSRQLTHQLRSLHDGILVGIDTVLADDPQLTVRDWDGKNPQPIVLDSRLRLPANSKLHAHPDRACWVLTLVNDQLPERLKNLKQEIYPLPGHAQDFVPLGPAMAFLYSKGIESLMVEGGARVITEFIKAGLADAVVMTIAPRFLGGYKAVGDLGIEDIALTPKISPLHFEKSGDDLIVWGDMQFSEFA